jgi:hypothetical protein
MEQSSLSVSRGNGALQLSRCSRYARPRSLAVFVDRRRASGSLVSGPFVCSSGGIRAYWSPDVSEPAGTEGNLRRLETKHDERPRGSAQALACARGVEDLVTADPRHAGIWFTVVGPGHQHRQRPSPSLLRMLLLHLFIRPVGDEWNRELAGAETCGKGWVTDGYIL